MVQYKREKTLEEVLGNTQYDNGCMLWRGGQHQQGYGMMRQRGKMRSCHSVVAELKYGYAPDKYHGERVTRTCKNNLCLNPDHIIIEKSANIKRRPYHCVNRKLTQDQARDIRTRLENGERGLPKKLAEEYDVPRYIIESIKYNRSYKEIPNEDE